MTEGILTKVVGFETSAQVWAVLEVYFTTHTSAKIDQFTTQLQNFKKGSLALTNYLLKVKSIVDRLGSIGLKVSAKEHIAAIFKGLPPEYDTFIIFVNSRSQPYTVAEIESLLFSQEHRMERQTQEHRMERQTQELDSVNLAQYRGYKGRGTYSNNSSNFTNRSNSSASNFSGNSTVAPNPSTGRGLWNSYAASPCGGFSSSSTTTSRAIILGDIPHLDLFVSFVQGQDMFLLAAINNLIRSFQE
ncbi:uncharacterized protein LOC133802358 [Humulus lupulus]|uniref:uncharacterized protein LOC133802358 n=1 Tax=Humulus lupulus TaxID=3486 RepID=UPI002B40B215|nr:uncharacterized protein LOC133802358 [Humulus lupulus]